MPLTTLSWNLSLEGNRTPDSIPFTDRGLRYGMSVFETIAWTGSSLLFIEEHLAALQQAARAADFPLPAGFFARRLTEIAAELPATTGMLRLYLTAGDGSPLDPVSQPRLFALYEDAAFPSPQDYEEGWSVCSYGAPIPCILGGWKTGNYWSHVQALAHARQEKCREALVFNATGALISASMANVFLVRGGHIRTPALVTGARPGIVRSWVLNAIPVEETLLSPEDVAGAEECFITNSRLGVMPIRSIDGRSLAKREKSHALTASYRAQIFGA